MTAADRSRRRGGNGGVDPAAMADRDVAVGCGTGRLSRETGKVVASAVVIRQARR